MPNDKWGYIDKLGAWVIKPRFDGAGDFSEGLAPVSMGEAWGYVAQSGELAIKVRFANAQQFVEGTAQVMIGGPDPKSTKFGYIDRSGKYIWEPSN